MNLQNLFLAAGLIVTICEEAQAREKAPPLSGRFLVEYSTSTNPELEPLQKVLRQTRLVDELAAAMNQSLRLPRNVVFRVADCGVINAFYDPASKTVTMCNEILLYFAHLFLSVSETEAQADALWTQATLFVLLHETGHALVDTLDLPILGREEDAVDDVATIALLDDDSGEGEGLLSGALTWFFAEGAAKRRFAELAFWDEHSLDLQRFYSMTCLLYGRNPEGQAALIQNGMLPPERAPKCSSEWAKKRRSLEKLLGPYERPNQ